MSKAHKWTRHSDLAINRRPVIDRDEYLDHMTFKTNKRPLFTEIFGPIIGLKEEWEAQGATPEELDFSAFNYRAPKIDGIAVNTWRLNAWSKTISETDTVIRYQDDLGRKLTLEKGFASLPLPQSYPVKTMDDWLAIKPRYQFSEARLEGDWERQAWKAGEKGEALTLEIPGGFDEPRQLMGEEELCCAYYEQPELIHDMLDTIGAMLVEVCDRVCDRVPVDILKVHEDMAGKSGPLAGPRQIDEFIKPYYRRVWDRLQERGTRLFDQDSDGDMEPAANMDMVKIRETYGTQLAFYGGIDKHVLRRSKQEIEQEIAYKVPPMLESGGCVLALDHRIPNGTPLENYRFYIKTMWEYMN